MKVNPQSDLRLCNVPLKNDYKNQITFSNSTAQANYFLSKVIHNVGNDMQYIRKDQTVNINIPIDNLYNVNYMIYKNNGFTNKWFYAFINRMEYVNENCTKIYFETDVFQTWQFDTELKNSFVVREHVTDDTVGANTIDEGVQLGEFIVNKKAMWLHDSEGIQTNTDLVIVLGATENNEGDLAGGVQTDGIYSGIRYYVFWNRSDGINALNTWLEQYAKAGKSDAIKCLFMLPRKFNNRARQKRPFICRK